jgi:hypothetical protein
VPHYDRRKKITECCKNPTDLAASRSNCYPSEARRMTIRGIVCRRGQGSRRLRSAPSGAVVLRMTRSGHGTLPDSASNGSRLDRVRPTRRGAVLRFRGCAMPASSTAAGASLIMATWRSVATPSFAPASNGARATAARTVATPRRSKVHVQSPDECAAYFFERIPEATITSS